MELIVHGLGEACGREKLAGATLFHGFAQATVSASRLIGLAGAPNFTGNTEKVLVVGLKMSADRLIGHSVKLFTTAKVPKAYSVSLTETAEVPRAYSVKLTTTAKAPKTSDS